MSLQYSLAIECSEILSFANNVRQTLLPIYQQIWALELSRDIHHRVDEIVFGLRDADDLDSPISVMKTDLLFPDEPPSKCDLHCSPFTLLLRPGSVAELYSSAAHINPRPIVSTFLGLPEVKRLEGASNPKAAYPSTPGPVVELELASEPAVPPLDLLHADLNPIPVSERAEYLAPRLGAGVEEVIPLLPEFTITTKVADLPRIRI